jgi:hypothetical protein
MKTLFFFLLSFSTTLLSAQNISFPVIKKSVDNLQGFLPKHWVIKSKSIGDLNGDRVSDLVMILEHKGLKPSTSDSNQEISNPRILLVFFKNVASGKYDLFIQNNSFIVSSNTGPIMDPETEVKVEISKGVLDIFMGYFHGNIDYNFRFLKNDLYLIHSTKRGVWVEESVEYKEEINFETKKTKTEETSMEDGRTKIKHVNLSIKSLKRLRDMKEMLSWEVLPGHYI